MKQTETRKYWLDTMTKLAMPVLEALSRRQLKAELPITNSYSDPWITSDICNIEAFAAILSGIAPFLESEDICHEERETQDLLRNLARDGLDAGSDPSSPDYFCWDNNGSAEPYESIVSTATLCIGIVRAKTQLWDKLDSRVKENLLTCIKKASYVRPMPYCNWLLFGAMVEICLFLLTGKCETMKIEYALVKMNDFYLGDGIYGDGPEFAWDYYNSFVIQPYMLEITDILTRTGQLGFYGIAGLAHEQVSQSIKRYSSILERMIAPDGSFPVLGRSITYRMGTMHALSEAARKHLLSDSLPPAQARCALTKVIKKCLESATTYDEKGFLRPGLYGSQPSLPERYVNTSTLYWCMKVFTPLGMPPCDSFWADKDEFTTWEKAWSGMDMTPDISVHNITKRR